MATWLTHSLLHPFLTSCFPGVALPDKLVSHKHLLQDLLSREIGDICVHACVLSRFSHVWLFTASWTVARQAPLTMGFSRQEYWNGLPCPPPEDLPNPRIKPRSSALQDSLPSKPPEKPLHLNFMIVIECKKILCEDGYVFWPGKKVKKLPVKTCNSWLQAEYLTCL